MAVLVLSAARGDDRDRDGDNIPDSHDPFPDDRDRPGRAQTNTIYANTSDSLARISRAGEVEWVGRFRHADGKERQVTDLAVDRWGVLWAVAFSDLLTCHPETARCEVVRSFPERFNALAADHHYAHEGQGLLYAVTLDGAAYHLHAKVSRPGLLHRLPAPSSGDAFLWGRRVYVSTSNTPEEEVVGPDNLIRGGGRRGLPRFLRPLSSDRFYGFAACRETVFGFTEAGGIYRAADGFEFELLRDTEHGWWGATCSPAAFADPLPAPVDSGAPPRPLAEPLEQPPSPPSPGEPATEDPDNNGCFVR